MTWFKPTNQSGLTAVSRGSPYPRSATEHDCKSLRSRNGNEQVAEQQSYVVLVTVSEYDSMTKTKAANDPCESPSQGF